MVRFDFACKKCETTFTAWSDEAHFCPLCGSKRVFKVFLTPPAASTGNAARIEKLAERQLDAAGLSNYTNKHGSSRRTRKTDPKMIEAIASAKANNIDMDAIFPTGPSGTIQARPMAASQHPLAASIAARGKGVITQSPKGTGALVSNIINVGKRVAPLAARGERIYSPSPKQDSEVLASYMRK